MHSSHFPLRDWLFADEAVVLIIAVILGVPPEVVIKVHVKEGLALRLLVILPVGEAHHLPSEPVDLLVPVDVHGTQPVVGPVLGVDHHQDVLEERVLLLAEDVSEVGPLLRAAVHGRLKVEPCGGEPVAAGVVVVPALLTGWVGWHKSSLLQHQLLGQRGELSRS